MRKQKFINVAVALFCCLFTTAFTSCDDDDKPAPRLRFDVPAASVTIGQTHMVRVTGGDVPYVVTSGNDSVVQAYVVSDSVFLTGIGEGEAMVYVADSKELSGTLIVNVVAPDTLLNLDKLSVKLAVDEHDTITIENGEAPYTIVVEDSEVATASLNESEIVITALKAGVTNVVVSDEKKRVGTIRVEVSE